MLGDLDSYMQKQTNKQTNPQSPTYTIHKNRLEMNKRLKYKLWQPRSPGRDTGRKISDNSHSNILTNMSPRARDIKERINKWDYIRLKNKTKQNKTKQNKTPAMPRETSAKGTGNKPYGKIYLPMIPRTKVWSPKYIKNSHDSTPGRHKTQLKNGQSVGNRPAWFQRL